MSAWIVSRQHIDHIVTAVIRAELVADTPDNIGRMLWRECLASVAYRYPNDKDGDRPGPVDFRDSDVDTYTWTEQAELEPGVLVSTVKSYRYQSCEHPGWETSEASAIARKLLAGLAGTEAAKDADGNGWDW